MFRILDEKKTGLRFNNHLIPTPELNMFNYMYYYNGAGVAAGDFNGDGWIDLFFASNLGENKLFINQTGLRFKDISKDAMIPEDHGWSTGVSVVDINNDGLLDIYICRVGHYKNLEAKNQLLVCQGKKENIPYYKDEAKEYGLDFSGFSTQAAFLDYDRDGDLDMYLLNHNVHQDGSFADRKNFLNKYDSLGGDRLYRNEGGHFKDVTRESGINSSAIGYGLGISVADINMDGWPDIYIGNDFHENDYLYINQRNGTFRDENRQWLMHTSNFSMGVDVADANNDGLPDIVSMDMLPYDPVILKSSLGDNDYDVFYQKIKAGYAYQYPRNNLQYNRNGVFSETGCYSGVEATDWSWAPLWIDFDNDGWKDLFISNGIPKRLNNMDYINFIYSGEMQEKLNGNLKDKDIALADKFPEIKIPNKFYRNDHELKFRDIDANIESNPATYSNGSVYADLDNDGDLDIVVNNINDPAMVYENTSNDRNDKSYAEIVLTGPLGNRNASGAKVIVFAGSTIRVYEKNPVRGFMSSMETPIHIGYAGIRPDSSVIIWPDNSYQPFDLDTGKKFYNYTWRAGLPVFDYNRLNSFHSATTNKLSDITTQTGLAFVHQENPFNEFIREPLMAHMVSTEGPALAVADINHDGLEDVFIGVSKTFHPAVFVQQANGEFKKTQQPAFAIDSMYEDVDATWTDINNDGNPDLVIASGGNEYYGTDSHLLPRLFINDGKGQLQKKDDAFSNITSTISCVAPYDFNGDGFTDLFIGGRAVPWEYGQIPFSYLLQNDGTGKFSDVTAQYATELSKAGMVTGATWNDIDKDGDKDLIVCLEWGGIESYINNKGSFVKKEICNKKGWWNFLEPVDIDNDGDIDFVAGNLGLNSRLHASADRPVRLYYNDFDGNGKKEQVITYYLGGKEIPLAGKPDLEKQVPVLKKKFLRAEDFARASLEELFSKDKLASASILTADYFSNIILINDGQMNFTVRELPWQAQLTTYRDAAITNANGDDLPDILLGGNYYENAIQLGRCDADFGTLLINKGKGNFTCERINGTTIKGQVRHIRKIKRLNKDAFVLGMNNDSVRVISY